MEDLLAKLSSDNPDVLLLALLEAEGMSRKENSENQPIYDMEIFYREVQKKLDNTKFFIAFSKAVIMYFIRSYL